MKGNKLTHEEILERCKEDPKLLKAQTAVTEFELTMSSATKALLDAGAPRQLLIKQLISMTIAIAEVPDAAEQVMASASMQLLALREIAKSTGVELNSSH